MKISIKKIKKIPFEITQEDEVLSENLSLEEVSEELNKLGFGERKEKIINGVKVYYKSRRNGVYISYN